jgi:translation initiation factor IF-3
VDLVEISAAAVPPVCRLVEIGKYRYELAKREKESRKHQHASTVKEIQLSPRIDPHDLGIKVMHAVGFLCEDMKVKVALKFRGREMAHTEFGFEVVKKFIVEIAPFGHPDFEPKLVGRSINLMISPLPRNKRAKNPHQMEGGHAPAAEENHHEPKPAHHAPPAVAKSKVPVSNQPQTGGLNSPFAKLEIK